MNNIVIVKPVISEKSFTLASTGVYVFHVAPSANKATVATQIHEVYKVDVTDVKIINTKGKVKKSGRKIGKRSDVKKAYVKVKAGQKIAIFETEEEKPKEDKKAEAPKKELKKDIKKVEDKK